MQNGMEFSSAGVEDEEDTTFSSRGMQRQSGQKSVKSGATGKGTSSNIEFRTPEFLVQPEMITEQEDAKTVSSQRRGLMKGRGVAKIDSINALPDKDDLVDRAMQGPAGSDDFEYSDGETQAGQYNSNNDQPGIETEEEFIAKNTQKMNEMAQQLGEKTVSKTRVFVIIGCIAICAVFLVIGATRDKKQLEKIEAIQPQFTDFAVKGDVLEYSRERYSDTMKVSKFLRKENGYVQAYLKGKPKNFPEEILIPVIPEIYNKVKAGQTIRITYSLIELPIVSKGKNSKKKSAEANISKLIINPSVVTKQANN